MKENCQGCPPVKRARAKLNSEGLHITLEHGRIVETWEALPFHIRLKFCVVVIWNNLKHDAVFYLSIALGIASASIIFIANRMSEGRAGVYWSPFGLIPPPSRMFDHPMCTAFYIVTILFYLTLGHLVYGMIKRARA